MKTEIGDQLIKTAIEFSQWLNTPKPEYPNYTFTIQNIYILSESIAIIKYKKKENQEQTLAFFKYSDYNNTWNNKFIIKHSDAEGMMKVMKHLDQVEQHNYNIKHPELLTSFSPERLDTTDMTSNKSDI